MKNQPLLIVLTAINLGLFSYQLLRPHPGLAATPDVPAVIRGHALEIVDDRGKVRASISVIPEDPQVIWNGKPYPETTLLRLMSPEGRPNVKIGATRLGAGLLIAGQADPTYVQVKAEGGETTMKLINKDSRQRVIQP